MLFQMRDAAATWFRRNTSCLFPAMRPNNHHAGADPVKFGRLAPRRACFDQFNHSYSQVVRIRLRHFFPPNRINAADSLIDKPLGILLDSSRAENALDGDHDTCITDRQANVHFAYAVGTRLALLAWRLSNLIAAPWFVPVVTARDELGA